MYHLIRLGNGMLADAPDLNVQGPIRLTVQRRYDLALAWEKCREAPDISVVLAKKGRIVAQARGFNTWAAACCEAKDQLAEFYQKHKWPEPNIGVVAAVKPFPLSVASLAGGGIDTVFALGNLGGQNAIEQLRIDEWLGSTKNRRRLFITYPFHKG